MFPFSSKKVLLGAAGQYRKIPFRVLFSGKRAVAIRHSTGWFVAPSAPSSCGEIIGEVIFQMNDAAPADSIRANPPVLMNEREVALFVGICPRSVRNFTARKLLPVIHLGRRRLYRRDAVLAALRRLEEGVTEFQRVSCFRLAVALRKAGLPVDASITVLSQWSSKNRPQAGKRTITPGEIASQVHAAYRSGRYVGCGCDDPAVSAFCGDGCAINRNQNQRSP